MLGLSLAAAELQATAWALPGAVAPVHRRAAAQAVLDGDRFLHPLSVKETPDGASENATGAHERAPGFVVLEEPDQQKDDDNERNETATDVHSGLLFFD